MSNGNLFNYYNELLLFMAPAFVGGLERGFPCFDSSCRTLRLVGKDDESPNRSVTDSSKEGLSRVPKETVVPCAVLIVRPRRSWEV